MQVKLFKPAGRQGPNHPEYSISNLPDNLLDLISDAVMTVDTSLVIRKWNRGAEATFGWTAREVVGKRITDFLPKPFGSYVIDAPINLFSNGHWEGQIEVKSKEGRPLSVSVNCLQAKDASGKPTGAVAVIRDVTALMDAMSEQGRVRQELLEQEDRLRLINENITEFIWMTDMQHRVVYITSSVKHVVGYEASVLTGKTLPFMGDSCPAGTYSIRDILAANLTNENMAKPDFRLLGTAIQSVRRKDGSLLWLESNLTIMRDASGHPAGIMGVGRDVTERMLMENEQQKIQKLQDLGILSGGIAHDFNNILTAIMTNIALVRSEADAIEREEMLGDAEAACQRAAGLTRQLLTFSKGGTPLKENVKLPELLRETAQFALRGSKVRCHLAVDENLWGTQLDRTQISQVIQNMVINAQEAMPDGGRILLRAVNVSLDEGHASGLPSGDFVRIDIEDNGPGISRENICRIFEPYFTTKAHGSGLGLAVCHNVITRHGGVITVDSQLGRGTSFHIYLPAKPGLVGPEGPEHHVPRQGSGRILVMDDDPGIRRSAERMLANLGYDVETAEDGAKALDCWELAREQGKPFDSVILDLTVPGGMGGRETVECLKAKDAGAVLIVSSGYSDDSSLVEYQAAGFDAAIPKPYTLDTLSRILSEALQTKRQNPPSA